jgi:lipoprotein signal peptidase
VGHRRIPALVPLTGAIIVADQLTKALAARRGLVATNPAYAFGVVGGPRPALIAGALVVLVAFLALLIPTASALGIPPSVAALITGGLLSNTLDRVRFGAARDFLTTPWAIVNLADIAVATGIIAFVVAATWRIHRLRSTSTADASPLYSHG